MCLHLSRLCLILLFAAINAQLYNDLGAAYTDQESVYGAEDTDDFETYDDGYDETGGGDDGTENVIFSAEKLNELYTCMCLGTSEECNIHYQLEGETWSVSIIHRNGTFQGDNYLCKYYLCSHEEVNQLITCSQLEQRSAACGAGTIAQFFRFKTHVCCGLTCIGLFWYSVEEQLSFVQNASEVESCDTSCLCPTDGGEEAPRPVKITAPSVSNDTQIDTYVIHKPERNISATGTSSSKATASSHNVTLSSLNVWTPTAKADNNTGLDLEKAPMSGSNDENQARFIIIVATSVAVVIIIIVIIIVIFIIRRSRRQRELTFKESEDKALETGSSHADVSQPHLNYFTPVGNSQTQYSRLPSAGAQSSATTIYKPSPKAPGFRNGINKPDSSKMETKNSNPVIKNDSNSQNSSEIKGEFNSSNQNVHNRVSSQPGESTGLISDGNENVKSRKSDGKQGPTSPSKDVKLRQPLLPRSEAMESVV